MKKLAFTLFTFFFATVLVAQVPGLINYQGVVRDNTGQPLANKPVHVRFTIFKNTVMQYSETREKVTNILGLFDVQIGSAGAYAVSGSLNNINWLNSYPGYKLKVEVDVHATGQFTIAGMQDLVSLPYSFATNQSEQSVNAVHALYADTASTVHFADSAATATEAVNIKGKPVDREGLPVAGDRLQFNGSKWVTKPADTIITSTGNDNIRDITNNWKFFGPTAVVTITKSGTINSNIASVCTSFPNRIDITAAVCYEPISGSGLTPFNTGVHQSINTTLDPSQLSVLGSGQLPPGTYRIGLGVKSSTLCEMLIGNVTGVIEIEYGH